VKKYKIAFVVNHFPSVSETFILNQITDLVERGHDIRIYSFKSKTLKFIHGAVEHYKLIERTTYFQHYHKSGIKKLGWFVSFFLKNGWTLIMVLKFKMFSKNALRKAIRNQSLSWSLENFLNDTDFDIVHAHFGQQGARVANLMARGRISNFKFVTAFHGYDLNPSFVNKYKTAYKNIFRFADAVTVNSNYLATILLAVCQEPKNLMLLPEGLKTEQYRKETTEFNRTLSNFTIVFCGRLVEFKAPDLAVQIIDILVNGRGFRNVMLRIIGEGRLRGDVEELIRKLALEDHVSLLGALSQENVVQEMNKADLFLLPGIQEKETGRAETQGLVIQEAQAMELPVVVSDAGGMKYGLIDGISGFVIKEGDIDAFADKIELLLKDMELRIKMGKAGRDFVVDNFDTKILGDKLLQLYSSI